MKKVLDVGQCAADHGSIRRMIESRFNAQVTAAPDAKGALSLLRADHFDLVLVNRILDADASDGLELIQQIRADPELAAIPTMLVSNYSQYQQQAIAMGAQAGFGKARLGDPATHERLARVLG